MTHLVLIHLVLELHDGMAHMSGVLLLSALNGELSSAQSVWCYTVYSQYCIALYTLSCIPKSHCSISKYNTHGGSQLLSGGEGAWA